LLLQEGIPAPEIELKDQNEKTHKLSDYRGKPVVLFFYPEDDTPGCTLEACNFRDDYWAYQDVDAVIIGISADDEHSHAKFVDKYDLPFTLLADVETKTSQAYGVWQEKSFLGKKYMGIARTSYLIDREGMIARTFEKVHPPSHSAEVLAALAELG
jgi:peroxiredoxin Q/BCP